MSNKRILWGVVMLIGLWLILLEGEVSLLGTIVLIVGAGFGLRELRKEKRQ